MKAKVLTAVVLAIACLFLLALELPLPAPIGQIDFRAYWSAGYLLQHGENFADPSRLFQVERDLTMWSERYPMITWNPPWLLVLLTPYSFVPFSRAVWWWLLTNIALVLVSALAVWQRDAIGEWSRRHGWIAWLVAFAFSPTLIALIAGQANILVLFGLASFLFLEARQRDGFAGAALALTMVKPQLVYLTVPIVLLDVARQRRWRVLLGFAGTLTGLSAIVFVQRPTFLSEYALTIRGGNLFNYATPTLGGWASLLFGWEWAKFIGLGILPLAVFAWWRGGGQWGMQMLVDVTLLVSVVTTPFDWSYDFVVLLVPLTRIITLIADGRLLRAEGIAVAAVLVCADFFSYYERILTPGEEYFFWIPLLIAGVYFYCVWRTGRLSSNLNVVFT